MSLSQVSVNLMENARYAAVQISLTIGEPDGGLALTVTANGPRFDGKMFYETWNRYVTREESERSISASGSISAGCYANTTAVV